MINHAILGYIPNYFSQTHSVSYSCANVCQKTRAPWSYWTTIAIRVNKTRRVKKAVFTVVCKLWTRFKKPLKYRHMPELWTVHFFKQTSTGWWFHPLWKTWKSVGMIIPNIWRNKIHVPNHQPDIIIYIYIIYHQYTPNVSIYTSTMDPIGSVQLLLPWSLSLSSIQCLGAYMRFKCLMIPRAMTWLERNPWGIQIQNDWCWKIT